VWVRPQYSPSTRCPAAYYHRHIRKEVNMNLKFNADAKCHSNLQF